MKRTLLLMLLLAPLAACATAQARTPVVRPNLDVPPPPPRIIEPVTPPAERQPEPVEDLPPNPATPKPKPAPARPEPAKPEAPKTETPAETPPAAAPPLPQLRTPNAPDAARQVKEIADRAMAMLNSIDWQALSKERQAQYNSAKTLIKQAEDAVTAGNVDFAKNLAEKAEKIAKELQGR